MSQFKTVSLVIPLYNEAAAIARKVENVSELDYPSDKLSVVFTLDGCTDCTERELRAALGGDHVPFATSVHVNVQNRGKIAVINEEISRADGEIIALSDASAICSPDSVKRAVAGFEKSDVGVVCGAYHVSKSHSNMERLYWRYQRFVKFHEGQLGSTIGAHGALYFFRKALWSPLPSDTVNDDFILPMSIVEKGYRAIYDVGIEVKETEQSVAGNEFLRRVRMGAGNLQQVIYLHHLLRPRYQWVVFTFISGKGLRALLPFLLLALSMLNVALAGWGGAFYRWLAASEAILLLNAIVGLSPIGVTLPQPVRILGDLCSAQVALLMGACLFLIGRGNEVWGLSLRLRS